MRLDYPITFPLKSEAADTYEDVQAGYTVYTLGRDPLTHHWVFRVNGVEFGRDRYRNDLAERCNFKFKYDE